MYPNNDPASLEEVSLKAECTVNVDFHASLGAQFLLAVWQVVFALSKCPGWATPVPVQALAGVPVAPVLPPPEGLFQSLGMPQANGGDHV